MTQLDKGLLFFYDWEECFDALPDRDFKLMVMAMLRYKKYGTPPPEFTGSTKIAASLIFPQLDRQIKDFENGKKGGRPKKQADNINTNKEENCASDEKGEPKLTYGIFNNVFLTKEEFAHLEKQFSLTLNRRINMLSKDLQATL